MTRATRFKDPTEPSADAIAASDVSGLVLLLRSAQSSIRTEYGDELCVGFLERCITNLRDRYNLTRINGESYPARVQISLHALARLLIYVRAEVTDELRDAQCASLLQQCIDRLPQMHEAHGKSH